jgi:hypothetical protein
MRPSSHISKEKSESLWGMVEGIEKAVTCQKCKAWTEKGFIQ